MSYIVSKTDGTAIIVLDGTKDTTSTSLTLFGRLVQNYGDQTNENFVRLLENFAYNTSPANPITGQLWFDTVSNNIKNYTTNNAWVTVGSDIVGNIKLSGNLIVSNTFSIQNTTSIANIVNNANNANIGFYSNVGGVLTNTLLIDGATGQVIVSANATNNFGVTTKIYVDSQLQQSAAASETNLLSNVATINANLTARINAENDLRANITAANSAISLRDTVTRVDAINLAQDTALQANVTALDNKITAANASISSLTAATNANTIILSSRVDAANAEIITANVGMKAYVDNLNSSVAANLTTYAPINSPTLTGVPLGPTAAFGSNTTQLATTAYVMIRSNYWSGSKKFISTQNPTSGDGDNGDLWFKYS